MHLNEHLVILFPKKKCNQENSKLLILKITMLQNQYLNMTISNLTCNEIKNIHCKYAGLSVYDLVNNSYEEISTICHSSERYKHRNIYSCTFYVLLVFYSYPEYRKFNTIVSLFSTSCNIVTLNACTLEYYCHYTDNKYCSYLKELSILKTHCIGKGVCHSRYPFIDITVDTDQCVLIQLTHSTDHYIKFPSIRKLFSYLVNMDFCNVRNLAIVSTIERVQTFECRVTGFLTG